MESLIFFIGLIIIYYLMYVKLPQKMNITHDFDSKVFNRVDVKEYVEKNFKDVCNYDSVANVVYICDNSIMTEPKFIKMLNTWKVYIQPSLF